MEGLNTRGVVVSTDAVTPMQISSHDSYEPSDDKTTLSAMFLVILTVILVVLILNIYTRWYLNRRAEAVRNRQHRRRRQQHVFTTSGTASTTTAAANRGLDPTVLNSIPIFTYSEAEDEMWSTEYCQECAVCLCEFKEREQGRCLPGCNHSFHVECIDMWFHSHSTCPLCRACVESVGVDDEFVVEMTPAAADESSSFPGSVVRVEEDVAKLSWSGLLSAGNFLRIYNYGNGGRNHEVNISGV